MAVVLARNWWLLGLRGLLAVIFGLLTIFNPWSSLQILILFFGAFALVDGIFAIIAGATAPKGNKRWGWLIGGGILGIFIGLLTLFAPLAAAFGLVFVIAFWAIAIGATQIFTAIRLRKEIEGEFWMILGGAVSILFGILAFLSPLAGALAVTFGIGIYALVFGVMLLISALRLRKWRMS